MSNKRILLGDASVLEREGRLRCRVYVLETPEGLEMRAQAGDETAPCQSLNFELKHPSEVQRGMEALFHYLRAVLQEKGTRLIPGYDKDVPKGTIEKLD